MQKARGQAFCNPVLRIANCGLRIESINKSAIRNPQSAIQDCSIALPLLVGIRFQVLFHSPHRGSFHLSLTVLVHYRSPGSI